MRLLTKTIARAFVTGLAIFLSGCASQTGLGGCTAETVITQAIYDVVVYGGTSGGVAAAVSAAYQQTDPGVDRSGRPDLSRCVMAENGGRYKKLLAKTLN